MNPWGLGLIWLYPCLIWGENPQGMCHLHDCTLNNFCVFHTTVLNYYLLVFMNHVDSSQLERSWRGELSWCLPLVMLYFCVISVSVDKLAAVPILCVEQLVSPLFCMNASQSAIISLWRSVPVWLCSCCIMTVFIRQDFSHYFGMLWCDKNKVHGFFVFLFCCSFESYRLL